MGDVVDFKKPEAKQTNQKVIVYSTESCPWCHKAKDFLKEEGIPYEDINVAEDQKAREDMIEKSGQMGVPVLDVFGTVIVGFDKEAIEAALAKHETAKAA
jgi:glutaredoxin 3